MLANILAVLLGLGSFVFYMAAFVYPEVHRRSNFLWGGLGLLYAGVLWFGAEQMTGLVLLGQVVAVVLLLGLGWQTLTVRRQKTPIYQQTPIVLTPEVVGGWAKSKLNELRIAPDENVRAVRLERRAVEGKVVGDRVDPRRRPAYDYEFVEDGVALAEVTQGELFAISSVEDALSPFGKPIDRQIGEAEEAMVEVDYAAPPSAEAEVIAEVVAFEVEASDAEVSDTEALDIDLSDVSNIKVSTPEEDLTAEPVGGGEEIDLVPELDEVAVTVTDGVADGVADGGVTDLGTVEAIAPGVPDASDDADDENWIDELEADAPETVEKTVEKPADSVRSAQNSKPSLMAMPLILAGWIKDVVVSLTKPKPAKPVIEIPRREPSVSLQARAKETTIDEPLPAIHEPFELEKQPEPAKANSRSANNRYNGEPTATEPTATEPTATEPTAADSIDDNWEESNWDD